MTTTDRPLRVIQWTTGNIGRRSLHAIIGRPDMEVVGVYAHGPDKVGVDAADLVDQVPAVRSLAWLNPPDGGFSPTASVEVRLSAETVVVEVDTSGTVDVEAERRRLEKDLAAAQKELARTGAKLGNEAFLSKAPKQVVDKIRARQQFAREEVERITGRLASFQ